MLLYPCADGAAHSSQEVMTLDSLGGQPVAKMIVLMHRFVLDPPQLSRNRRGRRVSREAVTDFTLIVTNLVLGKGQMLGWYV